MYRRVCAAALTVLFLCSPLKVAAVQPAISSASAILVDGDTGRVLYTHNSHEKKQIASITKLMTALVAVESTPDLDTLITVEEEWTLAEGSSIYLRPGETLTLRTLLYGLLLASGNDAALAVAGGCAGDVETFVDWMEQRAESLGMKNTSFANPSGLNDEEHYSTAYDMSLLARECLAYPELCEIMATRSITLEGHSFANHNKLLWQYEGCIGMKTGYTQLAGRTLISAARREGQTLICVTLDDPEDWKDHAALLDYGFQTYPRHILARAGKKFRTLPVNGSLNRFVSVETSHDLFYPLGTDERVTAEVELPQRVEAPALKGTVAGSLVFFVDGEEIGRVYLLYGQTVKRDADLSWSPLKRGLEFLMGLRGENLLTAMYPPGEVQTAHGAVYICFDT